MLKLAGWIIKTACFTVLVLVLGNWVEIKGKTLSQHISKAMGAVDKTLNVKIADALPEAGKTLVREITQSSSSSAERTEARTTKKPAVQNDGISAQERARMRGLIRELTTE
jgi:hypothetical protein